MITYIFDFDGTIADSFPLVFEIIKRESNHLGCRIIQDSEIEKIRDLSSQQLLEYLEIPLAKASEFVLNMHEEIGKVIDEINIFPKLFETLEQLKLKNIQLGILSSNSEQNIRKFLNNHGMNHIFNFIYSENNLFGKAERLNELIKKYKINRKESIYIGDEIRDIEAGKKAGLRPIAVAWGFNSKLILASSYPEKILYEPCELLTIS